jgi:hypothetical protein
MSIEVEVSAACETIVVALEVKMIGWTVSIDGAPAKLREAEYGFLAAHVPAGEHRVRFEYRPLAQRWALVSLFAFLFVLILLVSDRPRLARRPSPAASASLPATSRDPPPS